MLIDGNSLTYRAFFALPPDMATASGQVTNAVFGFTSMLINLLRDQRPDQVVVAFDRPEPTFRHHALDTYKANRTAAPDVLKQQVGLVRQVIETLGIPIVELAGFEADDLIATLATQAAAEGTDVLVVTGDRDSYQLVSDPHIKVLYNRRGVSDYALYDEAGIEERTGVRPRRYLQYAALRGDTSDNLPGVPGVGEKTAAKLINAYGGHRRRVRQPRRPDAQAAPEPGRGRGVGAPERRAHGAWCATCPSTCGPAELVMAERDMDELRRLFDFLEFRTLMARLEEALALLGTGAAPPAADLGVLEAELRVLEGAAEAVEVLGQLAVVPGPLVLAGGWPTGRVRLPLEGVALVIDPVVGDVAWLPVDLLDDAAVVTALSTLVGAGRRPLAGHGLKALLRTLLDRGVPIGSLHLDTSVAAYLLDPAESRYELEELLPRHAGLELPVDEPEAAGQLAFDGEGVGMARRTARLALAAARLVAPLEAQLDELGLRTLDQEVEVPLVLVLAHMEHAGIAVDHASWSGSTGDIGGGGGRRADQGGVGGGRPRVQRELHAAAAPGAPRRARPGPAEEDEDGVLDRRRHPGEAPGQHPVVEHLLRYREVEKLRSTYGDGRSTRSPPMGASTPPSSRRWPAPAGCPPKKPNLHNVPVRSEMGRAFRKAFVAPPGLELCVADYNQIELRCIAHLAHDPGLVEAFETHQDIHTTTAAQVFGVEPGDVTMEMRSKAKMVSYGLAYGMESYGLAQRLNIAVAEATAILDAYFIAFPAVRAYMDHTVVEAAQEGLHRDALRSAPLHPRADLVELAHPPGRGAPGHERRHPGPGRGHLQGGPGAPGRRSQGPGTSQPGRAPGPRRGHPRSTRRRARHRRRPGAPDHGRCLRPRRAPRGQPGLRPHLGRCQVLTAVSP